MGSVDSDMTMTTAQRFAEWLAPAMRRKGLNIDALRGGGKSELAEAVGVSPSTVLRWLSGKTAPDLDKYEPIATFLDTEGRKPGDATIDLLVEIGVISSQTADRRRKPAIDSPSITPTDVADGMRIYDPMKRQLLRVFLDGLTRDPGVPPEQENNGGAAAEA